MSHNHRHRRRTRPMTMQTCFLARRPVSFLQCHHYQQQLPQPRRIMLPSCHQNHRLLIHPRPTASAAYLTSSALEARTSPSGVLQMSSSLAFLCAWMEPVGCLQPSTFFAKCRPGRACVSSHCYSLRLTSRREAAGALTAGSFRSASTCSWMDSSPRAWSYGSWSKRRGLCGPSAASNSWAI